MKRVLSLLLLILISVISLSSCHKEEVSAPTCDEVIAAYKEAGYHVSHHENNYKDESSDEICYVKVWLDDIYESAYFNFYESSEAAEAYNAEGKWNIFLYLYSIIYGDPTWVYSKTYGSIQYHYEDPEMIKPFKNLVK